MEMSFHQKHLAKCLKGNNDPFEALTIDLLHPKSRWTINTKCSFIVCYLGVSHTLCSVSQSCPTLQPRGLGPTRLLCPWHFPGKNTGVGCHFLLQGVFLTQGSNLHLLHWQLDS